MIDLVLNLTYLLPRLELTVFEPLQIQIQEAKKKIKTNLQTSVKKKKKKHPQPLRINSLREKTISLSARSDTFTEYLTPNASVKNFSVIKNASRSAGLSVSLLGFSASPSLDSCPLLSSACPEAPLVASATYRSDNKARKNLKSHNSN